MRWLVLLIGLPVSVGLCLVSMIANWRFGIRLGAEDGDAWAYGLASVSADGLKMILPFAIAWAWQRRKVAEWLAGACLWLIITVYSLVSALSFAAVNRDEISGRRLTAAQVFADLRIELDAKRNERGGLAHARPTGTLEAEIRASEQQPRYAASRQCTETPTRDVRQFCERYFVLQGELETAKRAERLDAELAAIKTRLEALPPNGLSRRTDPQVELFRNLSGLSEDTIKAALAVLVCLLIEIGSGLGLFVVMSCHRSLGETARPLSNRLIDITAAALVPSDDDWVLERLERDAKALIGAAELYADYRMWLEARGRGSAMTVTAFGRWMSDLGLTRDKSAGRIVYRGVRIRPAAQLIAR